MNKTMIFWTALVLGFFATCIVVAINVFGTYGLLVCLALIALIVHMAE